MSQSVNRANKGRFTTCTVCGKRGYFTRKTARELRSYLNHKGDGGLHVYGCLGGLFHIGHATAGTPRALYEAARRAQLARIVTGDFEAITRAASQEGRIVIACDPAVVPWVANMIAMHMPSPKDFEVVSHDLITDRYVYALTRGRTLTRLYPGAHHDND